MTLPENPTQGPSTNTAVVEVNKVAARIPVFWKDDLDIWFAQVESQFLTSGITTDETKFNAIVGALDGNVLQQVKSAVVSPPATEKYNNIKRRLLERFDCSEQVKLRKLCSQMELGDRKPSQLLNEMRDLGGTAATETLLYTLWIDRLPTTVVVAVLEGSQENLDGKAALADRIIAALGTHSIAQTSSALSTVDSPRDQINAINQRIEKLSQKMDQLFGNNHRQRAPSRGKNSRGRSRSKTPHKPDQSGTCYYHRKFGAEARKCSHPCSFSGRENTNSKN